MGSVKKTINSGKFDSIKKAMMFLLCALLFMVTAVSAQGDKSVVRMRVDNVGQGTGFVYSSPQYAVTALHVVAGAGPNSISVYSEAADKSSPAAIEKVHKKSDLALLKLANPFGFKALKEDTLPNLNAEHTIWGYPHNIATMSGDNIRFSRSGGKCPNPTLMCILKTGDKIITQLKNQGYPSTDVSILRVGSTISPGHSGAPILDGAGMVVGIADGGLRGGTSRINWAIPATYLPDLLASTDPAPGNKSMQSELFSAGPQEEAEDPVEVAFGDNQLTKDWTISLAELYDYMGPEEQAVVDKWNSLANEYDFDILQNMIDVYEDYNTGATISVPKGAIVNYHEELELFEVLVGKVEMAIQITEGYSWEDGQAAVNQFANILSTWADHEGNPVAWQENPEIPDSEPEVDMEEEYYYAFRSRVALDANNETGSQMLASFHIDYGDFLGTASFIHDMENLTVEDLKNYYLVQVCIEMSDFAIQ